MINVAATVEPATLLEIHRLARQQNRTLSYIIRKAIEASLGPTKGM
jgi:predicted transcriptional regulator